MKWIGHRKLFGALVLTEYKKLAPSDVDVCSYCKGEIKEGHNFYHHFYLNRSYCSMDCASEDQTNYFLGE